MPTVPMRRANTQCKVYRPASPTRWSNIFDLISCPVKPVEFETGEYLSSPKWDISPNKVWGNELRI